MSKEILLVYQDCAMCGAHKNWGEKQTKVANDYGLEYRKVSFVSKEVTEAKLMWKAVKKGIRSYPFFTDGVRFSKNLADFVEDKLPVVAQNEEKPAKSVNKSSKKPAKGGKKTTRRKKTEVKDGASTEN